MSHNQQFFEKGGGIIMDTQMPIPLFLPSRFTRKKSMKGLSIHSWILVTSLVVLSGCAGSPPYSEQAHANPTRSVLSNSEQKTINIKKPQITKENKAMTVMVLDNPELLTKGFIPKSNAQSSSSSNGESISVINSAAHIPPTQATTVPAPLKLLRPKVRIFNLASGQKTLAESDIKIIHQHARYLLQNPALALNINGNTDARGSKMANLRLSRLRAEEVADQLVKFGVARSRLHIFAWGESKPARNIKNYAENRRIELEYTIRQYAENDQPSRIIH